MADSSPGGEHFVHHRSSQPHATPRRRSCRRRRTSSAARSSTTSGRPSRSCSSPGSTCSASRGCGSPRPPRSSPLWRRPWRTFLALDRSGRTLIVALGSRLRRDERLLLRLDRPAAAGDGGGDRVHRPDRARGDRCAHGPQRRRGRGGGRRRLPADARAFRRASRSESRSPSRTRRCSPPTSSSPTALRGARG